MKVPWSFEMSAKTHTTQYHIPGYLNPEQHHCENFKSWILHGFPVLIKLSKEQNSLEKNQVTFLGYQFKFPVCPYVRHNGSIGTFSLWVPSHTLHFFKLLTIITLHTFWSVDQTLLNQNKSIAVRNLSSTIPLSKMLQKPAIFQNKQN